MSNQKSLDEAYMACARALASLSYARRKKVGAVLVDPVNKSIIAEGINGTITGTENNCEIEIKHDWIFFGTKEFGLENAQKCKNCTKVLYETNYEDINGICQLITKSEVIHAELNCILKIARSHNSSVGATMYITCSPCIDCSKLIIQSGIKRVVYDEEYRNLDGLIFLKKNNIEVIKL